MRCRHLRQQASCKGQLCSNSAGDQSGQRTTHRRAHRFDTAGADDGRHSEEGRTGFCGPDTEARENHAQNVYGPNAAHVEGGPSGILCHLGSLCTAAARVVEESKDRIAALDAYADREAELMARLSHVTHHLAQAAADAKGSRDSREDKDLPARDEDRGRSRGCGGSEAEVRERHKVAKEKFKAQHAQLEGLLAQAHKDAEAASARDGSRKPRRKPPEPAVDLTAEGPGEARTSA